MKMLKNYSITKVSSAFILLNLIAITAWGQMTATFTANGTWTCPPGVTTITVECWGAGGGCGTTPNTTGFGGGSGGGGAYAKSTGIVVVPGNTYNVVVGTSAAAANGGSSSFNGGTVLAVGGIGSANGSQLGGAGGAAASCTGTTRYSGGSGANGVTGTNSGGGGGGAGSTGNGGNASGATAGTGTTLNGGNGGPGRVAGGNAQAGNNYGGGAGGGYGKSRTGAAGAPGYVVITYPCPAFTLTSTSASSPISAGTPTTVTLNGSYLPIGTYTVTYNLSAPNAATGLTAPITVTVAGTGTFTTSNLMNAGATTVTITNLASGTCSNAVTANNTSTVTVNAAITYCTSNATSTADEDIFKVTYGTLSNTSTCATTGGPGSILNEYSNYTTTVAAPNITQGVSTAWSVQVGTCGGTYSNGIAIWIDLNMDGDFADAGEKVYNSATTTSGAHTENGNITIPVTSGLGITRMRVICMESSVPTNPCGTYSWGETEDYNINIVAAAACAGTPIGGTTNASPNPTCPGASVALTVSGSTSASGLTYQWESSPDGSTWTNIVGATNATHVVTPLVSTYYRRKITCTASGQSAWSTSLQVVVEFSAACYCASSATSTADQDITNVSFGSINNTTTCSSLVGTQGTATGTASLYSNFWSSVAAPSVMQGATIPLTVIVTECGLNYFHRVDAYIDFNQNGLLTDPGESFAIFAYASPGTHTINYNIPIPITATTGNTLMRIIAVESSTSSPCGTYTWGETEDYKINIVAAVACAGTPEAGTASGSPTLICSGSSSTLTCAGYSVNSGITFQWQSSPTGGAPWTNIGGATSISCVVSPTSNTYYRCLVTCTNGGATDVTNNVLVTIDNFFNCLCASTATSAGDEDITKVSIGTLNNATNCADLVGTQGTATGTASLYSNFMGSGVPVPSLMQGASYPLTVKIADCGASTYSHRADVYIDFNHNGLLTDPGESFPIFAYSNPGANHTINYNLAIPITATTGNTIMRVICVESSTSNPCGTYSYGETEDYLINITAAVPCSGTPTPGTASASPESICIGASSTLTVSGFSVAGSLTFQWESSTDNITWTPIGGATAFTYTATPAVSTYYRCKVTCSVSSLFAYTAGVLVTILSQPNDLPCNAQWILTGDLTPGDNSCATGTGEPATPSCWGTPGNINTVWYKFQAPVTGNVKIKTMVGTLLNTQIALYSGTCGAGLVEIACNDDAPDCGTSSYYNSELSASGLTSGAWYYISVDGSANQTGTFSIVWVEGSVAWPLVPGQDCGSSVPVCASTFTVGNPGYQAVGNICDFGTPYCLLSGERGSAWYEITINGSGNLMFTIEPNDAVADGTGLITDDGTDYDFAIWKHHNSNGTEASSCAEILGGAEVPLACNYSFLGITGLFTGGNSPTSNSYTGHTYTSGAYDAAYEPPLAVQNGEVYWLVISNFSNSQSGFTINFTNSTNTFNFSVPNPLIWTGGGSSTNWFDPRNWGNCSTIPTPTIDAIVAASSIYQPVIAASGAECKSLTINSGASLGINAGYGLDIYGNYNNQGTLNAATTSDVNMKGTVAQTMNGIMISPSEFGNLTINKSASSSVSLQQYLECSGNLTTSNTNSLFNQSSNQIHVAGNISLANNTLTTGSGSNAFFRCFGSGNQTINQGTGNSFWHFKVDKSAGNITLLSDMTVKYDFMLIWGVINTDANKVIYETNGAGYNITQHNTYSYINGNLRRYYNPAYGTAYNWCFPLGTATAYRLAEFTTPTVFTGPTYFDAAYVNPFTSTGTLDAVNAFDAGVGSYNAVSGIWRINPNIAVSAGTYTMKLWFNGGVNGANDFGLIDNAFGPLKRPTGSTLANTWTAVGGTLNASGTAGRTIAGGYSQRNTWNSFSEFGIGSTNVPLAVELVSFTANCTGTKNKVGWATATETNCDYFLLERSKDGITFEFVAKVNGHGSTSNYNYYEYLDNLPYSGTTYYRLKQFDFNGASETSQVISAKCDERNPFEIITVQSTKDDNSVTVVFNGNAGEFYHGTLFDVVGKMIGSADKKAEISGANSMTISTESLAPGVYMLLLEGENELLTRKIHIE